MTRKGETDLQKETKKISTSQGFNLHTLIRRTVLLSMERG